MVDMAVFGDSSLQQESRHPTSFRMCDKLYYRFPLRGFIRLACHTSVPNASQMFLLILGCFINLTSQQPGHFKNQLNGHVLSKVTIAIWRRWPAPCAPCAWCVWHGWLGLPCLFRLKFMVVLLCLRQGCHHSVYGKDMLKMF